MQARLQIRGVQRCNMEGRAAERAELLEQQVMIQAARARRCKRQQRLHSSVQRARAELSARLYLQRFASAAAHPQRERDTTAGRLA